MVRVVVVYDISDDRKRVRLANSLKRLGLSRIQRSAFTGKVTSSGLKDIMRICELFVTNESDIIHVFTLCGFDWSRRRVFSRSHSQVTENVVMV